MPAVVDMQDTVAVAGEGGNVTLLGVIVPQLRPEGTVSDNDTVPEKPLRAAIIIVEVAGEPGLTGEGDEAEMEKSLGQDPTVAPSNWDSPETIVVMLRVPPVNLNWSMLDEPPSAAPPVS